MRGRSRVAHCENTRAVSQVRKASGYDGRRDYPDKASQALWLAPAKNEKAIYWNCICNKSLQKTFRIEISLLFRILINPLNAKFLVNLRYEKLLLRTL